MFDKIVGVPFDIIHNNTNEFQRKQHALSRELRDTYRITDSNSSACSNVWFGANSGRDTQ